jgi:uncharacterized membrane protein
MADPLDRSYSEIINPLHAVLLAGTIPLFVGALLSDWAYANTYHIQWNNFASWLIAGGLVLGGVVLLFTVIDLCRAHRRARGILLYGALVLLTWIIGFFNALMHARDAWASMPAGLWMSIIVTLLACVAAWIGFRTPRMGETR